MKIDINALDKYLPFYVSAIVGATMATCEAAALGRELTAEEIEETADRVANATYYFMRGYKTALKEAGGSISEEAYTSLYNQIYESVFNNAWALIQHAVDEMKRNTHNDYKSVSMDAGSAANKERTPI